MHTPAMLLWQLRTRSDPAGCAGLHLPCRASNVKEEDVLQQFVDARYQNVCGGRQLTSEEITGLMIAVLFAGQHTSSITSAWTGYEMINSKVSSNGQSAHSLHALAKQCAVSSCWVADICGSCKHCWSSQFVHVGLLRPQDGCWLNSSLVGLHDLRFLLWSTGCC